MSILSSDLFAAEPPKFELLDGDRVVLLGNTLIEREQKYGYWELMLTMAWPERNVTFRNLGWSGDTVWGESRAGFGTQADGFKALVEQVNAAKPTVIFVGYGNVEAFDGEAGLPRFIDGFNKLLDELEKTKSRIVVCGPVNQVPEVSKYANVEQYNRDVILYADAMKTIAGTRRARFLNWNKNVFKVEHPDAIIAAEHIDPYSTTNGMDRAVWGYIDLVSMTSEQLALPFRYHASHAQDDLRNAIIRKNELFFHRWRPQNETYLFGFRKHEQGNNAKEVFAFDPLVAAEEKKIAVLRVKLAAELKKASDAK